MIEQKTVSLSDEIDRILQVLASRDIDVEQWPAVRGYLNSHADMLDAVLDLCMAARAEFPPTTQLSLSLYVDPEIDDQYLTVFVRPDNYCDGIVADIERFAAAHESRFNGKSGAILVNTDFRPARGANAV